jgi:hypothetical protein
LVAGDWWRNAGEGARWREAAVSAAASIPVRRREVWDNAQCFELLWGLGEVLGRPSGRRFEQKQELARAAVMAARRGSRR